MHVYVLLMSLTYYAFYELEGLHFLVVECVPPCTLAGWLQYFKICLLAVTHAQTAVALILVL